MKTDKALADFLYHLKPRLQGDLRTDRYSRILYSTDASIYQVMPLAILIPKNFDDIHATVEAAAMYQIPIVARTGGSSLAGQAINEAVIIDMSRHLDKIIEINREEQWVRVQPGVVLDTLNQQLQSSSLQFGPDPASSNCACLGGIVANNATGSHSICYGMTVDHIREMKVILSDSNEAIFGPIETGFLRQKQNQSGLESQIYQHVASLGSRHKELIQERLARYWRRAGGYNLDRFVEGINHPYCKDSRFNLAKLICGSEGTLAIITELTLNLVSLPKRKGLALLHFNSLYEALSAVPAVLTVQPAAVEMFDDFSLQLCRQIPSYAHLLKQSVDGEPKYILITEFYGESVKELNASISILTKVIRQNRINTLIVKVLDAERQKNLWAIRKVGLGLIMSIKGDCKPIAFIEDASVPVEHLTEYVMKIEEFCHDIGTKVAYYGHASAGCLHIRPLINTKVAKDIAKLKVLGRFAADLVQTYGGANSSEHGDGRSRSWLNEQFYGKELYTLFKKTKQCFDPKGILNPGNIVDAQAIDDNLRYGSNYKSISINTQLDFSTEGGFHQAIEMCNGAGVCRKLNHGTMCPSFIATREEEHSTRGRANALRAALSGRLPANELTSKRMYELMDLCIECKGCKAECPSSVDMARLKFEFLAQYYQRHRIPLRVRMIAAIPSLNRLCSGQLAPVANWLSERSILRWILDRSIGISAKRRLPHFAREPFPDWFDQHRKKKKIEQIREKVILFDDTFTRYNEPKIGIAAVEFLEAAGFEVILAGIHCCGRPLISKGLLIPARQAALDTLQRLLPFADQGLPIIGLEPSCFLSVQDEYHYLLPKDPRVPKVAKQIVSFETFVTELAKTKRLSVTFKTDAKRILFHGHCHQKALIGTTTSKTALSLPPQFQVSEVDSGCCGMAGAFGYEREHYDLSVLMAQHRLIPAIAHEEEDTIIAATGTSCRQQIRDCTSRNPLHPAEILRQSIN